MKHFVAISIMKLVSFYSTFLFILFFLPLFGNKKDSIDRKVFFYKLIFQPDSTKSDKNESIFILDIKDGKSLFTDMVNRTADSMEVAIRERYQKMGGTYSFRGIPKPNFSYYIVKNLKDNHQKFYDKIGIKNFYYNENIEFDWELSKETKNYEGFICQKATTYKYGRKWVAWFALDIPLQDGPYKFCNLPGLILEVYDDRKQYHFQIVNYSSENNSKYITEIPLYRTKKLIETDRETFIKGKANYKNSKIERLKNSIIGNSLTNDDYNRIRQEMKKDNNSLEIMF